jgi:thiosulfate/3-mercaptopyruvate sulfurtransferase
MIIHAADPSIAPVPAHRSVRFARKEPHMTAGPIVSADWLAAHLDDAGIIVIDVRPAVAYQQAHLPGAISLDLAPARLARSTSAAIEQWVPRVQDLVRGAGITADRTVIFYEDISGTMSAYGVWLLDAAGLGNGAMLDGGIQGWYRAGFPLSAEPAVPTPADTIIEPDLAVVGTLDGLLAEIGNGDGQRVDARGDGEYLAGAMPGAAHVDWTRHLDPATGQFLPLDDLRALYAALDPSRPTTTYCAGGFRAANSYVVLKALGFTQPRNYAPSWGEWGMHPQTPRV